jgi:hypothetical protein
MGRGVRLLPALAFAACTQGDNPGDPVADAPCELRTFYRDGDGDTHGDPEMPMQACEQPPGTSDVGDDCDDRDANRAPGLAEVCDALDNDCNPATTDTCPAGCAPVRRPPPDDIRVYLMCLNPQSWAGAQAMCATAGADLVQIDDAAENSFIRSTANQMLGVVELHIGASDITAEGIWLWRGGTQFWTGGPAGTPTLGRFAAWGGGEPNNDNNEDCAEMRTDGLWNDGSCGDGQRFVCRR